MNTLIRMRLLSLTVAVVAASGVPGFTGALPRPVFELTFDNGLANTGSGKATITPVSYAPGEGPVLQPGRWGDCLDLTAASRFGGMVGQTEPAGGALLCRSAAVDDLRDFTITFWMQPTADAQPVSARVFTKVGSWEVMCDRRRLSFYVTETEGKRQYAAHWSGEAGPTTWLFAAVVVDQTRRQVTLTWASSSAEKLTSSSRKLAAPLVTTVSELQVGNLLGIRPFKGRLDNLRVYAQAFSAEQVRRRFDQDRAAAGAASEVYSAGVVATSPRRFQFRAADIPFSSRWQRRRRAGQPDLFSLLTAYHATHLLWVYGGNADFIRQVHALGLFYQGALSGMQGYTQATAERSARGDATGRQWDLDGNKFVLPHMEAWTGKPHWTGCHNSPAFRRLFWQAADQLVAAGVDGLHVDDWTMSLSSACRGQGCYCPWCMKMFRDYLKRRLTAAQSRALGIDDLDSFDYREFLKTRLHVKDASDCRRRFSALFHKEPLVRLFVAAQRDSLRRFYQDFRRHLDAVSPRKYLPVSVNNQFFRRAIDGRYQGAFCTDTVDFFIGETTRSMQTMTHFLHAGKLAEGFGVPQVMMCKPRRLADAKAALATTYALGAWMRVPWDVYMDNDPETGAPAPRYFGALADWRPFYDFVHDHPQLFDDYRTAAVVGVLLNGDDDTFAPVWDLEKRLSRAGIQFRVFVATSQFNRIPLDAEALNSVRWLVQVSPDESFCPEDRQTLTAARKSLRVRFLTPKDDIVGRLADVDAQLVRMEGPAGVYPFVRVKPGAAVIHLVNWNTDASGEKAAVFRHVALELRQPQRWGSRLTARYWQPGSREPVVLTPERHPHMVRLVVPELAAWGVVEIVRAEE